MNTIIKNFKLDAIENKHEINIPYDINAEIINIKPKSKNIENSKILKELIIFDNPKSENLIFRIKIRFLMRIIITLWKKQIYTNIFTIINI